VQEGISDAMLAFLLLLIVGSVVAMVWRWRDIPSRPLSDKFLSRDSFFALAILTLFIISLVIALGTSMPVISSIPGVGHNLQNVLGSAFEIDDGTQFGGAPLEDGRFNMATSFYDTVTPPLGLVAIALLVIAPLLGWRDTNVRNMLRALRWPAVAAVVATCAALIVGARDPLPLAYIGLSVFAGGVNILMIVRTMRGGWLRIGGYLAHVGLAVMLIGIVGSSVYATPDEQLAFEEGDSITFRDYTITFNNWQQTDDGKGVLDLTVQRGDEIFSAQPQYYIDQRMGGVVNPSIKSYIWQDLYIAPADYVPQFDPARPVMSVGSTNTMGPYEITFVDFDIDADSMMTGGMPDVGATLSVLYEGEETIITPRLQILEAQEEGGDATLNSIPATLPGGETIALATLDPRQEVIMLQGQGGVLDTLPVQPARAVITASVKPAVLLVWVGLIVGVIGGMIAFVRRYKEGQAHLSGQRVRLPRGVPGLSGLPGKMGWRGGSAARR
jgi:cytochrome c-type biogenesis protein CcmF